MKHNFIGEIIKFVLIFCKIYYILNKSTNILYEISIINYSHL
jgi:hypothetical protein